MDWRLIRTAPASGAANMAIDQALFERVKADGRPVVRFYRWDPPCLSLGRNQPARTRIRREPLRGRGIDLVRRPTGGMAVYHDRELTYAVVVPVGTIGSPRETYEAVNRALVGGLRRIGVPAGVADAGGGAGADAYRPEGASRSAATEAVCFRAPAAGEVVAGSRKLVGSAQRCERRTLLQHGSILLDGGQDIVLGALDEPGDIASPPVTLTELLERPPTDAELTTALRAGLEEVLGIRLAPAQLSDAERTRVRELIPHFESDAWTWRR